MAALDGDVLEMRDDGVRALDVDGAMKNRLGHKLRNYLVQIPRHEWPAGELQQGRQPDEVWQSRKYVLLVYRKVSTPTRLSIRRSDAGRLGEKPIPWEDLQRLKGECGRGTFDAVEVYPDERDVVNVANMRHLWIQDGLEFAWRSPR